MQKLTLHLLPNAHLDPVWLWDWREGLNEGLITVRTILDLMDEETDLTFMRGEAAVYEHIEKTDRKTFERILRMVDAGRWDPVGGTYIQPDSNQPSAETLCRHFERGLRYFESRFGRRPTIAWQADSFGHTPGWPNILAAFGMEGFAYTRPQRAQFPLASPVFWWESGADRLLCYRQHWMWYCSERFNLSEKLDATLAGAKDQPYRDAALLMGLGNHGGGPSRRHIQEVREWAAAHPEVEVRFSTLHQFFATLQSCETATSAPVVQGDIGYCLRGCYSAVAKFKNVFRRTEALLTGAEASQAIISTALRMPPDIPLDEAWEAMLFNSFHDILPGSSIERAYDDQLAWVGLAGHRANQATLAALNRLALEIDSRVEPPPHPDAPTDVALLAWNPLPRAVQGWFEMEASLDYRPFHGTPAVVGSLPLKLVGPDGSRPHFQEIDTEHASMRDAAWRKRVAVYDELPAWGWKVYTLGLEHGESNQQKTIESAWNVEIAQSGLAVTHHGRPIFSPGKVLGVRVVEDHWGSWGGMTEQVDSYQLETLREEWEITQSEWVEKGPFRKALWTRWEGKKSWLELTFITAASAPGVRVQGRLLMNDRGARVKLILPCTGPVRMEVPAGEIERSVPGSLPCGRWVSRGEAGNQVGFVSDVLGDVDISAEELRITLARSSRYADDACVPPDKEPWRPAVDSGELRFHFLLTSGNPDLRPLAAELLHPPIVLPVPAQPGTRARMGSLGTLAPACLQLLSAQVSNSGDLVLRIQNCSDATVEGFFDFADQPHALGSFKPREIRSRTVGQDQPAGWRSKNSMPPS